MTTLAQIMESGPVVEVVVSAESAAMQIQDSTLKDAEMFEDILDDADMNQAEDLNAVGLTHKLCPGLYARALRIPKGTFLTGKIHKKPYIDLFISGDVTVKSFLSDGTVEDTQRVDSFQFFEGKPGRKRVLYAHEDTLWVTCDPTEATDIDLAEDDISVYKMDGFKALKEGSE